jgi:hypothetical protein
MVLLRRSELIMIESVALDSSVYNLPLVYGVEYALVSGDEYEFILPEDNKYCYEIPNSNTCSVLCAVGQTVRVILGHFGEVVRLSAPEISVVTEGQNPDEAWAKFLIEISKREDSASLSFDVGPTRRDEIIQGLNAPEDEDWDGLFIDAED